MKLSFTLDQEQLESALSLLQGVCGKRTAVEATTNILLGLDGQSDELILKATDLEISLQCTLPLLESSIGEGHAVAFLVGGRRFFELIKELSGPLVLTYDGVRLTIVAQDIPGTKIALATADASLLPALPENIENCMVLASNFVRDMLSRVCTIIPSNNANPALNGLLVEAGPQGLSFVATDGFSLVRILGTNYTVPTSTLWTMPKKAVMELRRILDVFKNDSQLFLGLCQGQLVFSGQRFNFFTRLINEPFPAYQKILNYQDFTKGQLTTSQLSPALRRSGFLLSGRFLAAKLIFSTNQLALELDNPEVGNLQETAPLAQLILEEPLVCRFFPPYLLAALQAFEVATLDFWIKSKGQPIFFEHQFEQFNMLYLVMPVADNA